MGVRSLLSPVLKLTFAATLLASTALAQVPADQTQTLLQAERVEYDENSDIVTAIGKVEIERDGRILLADKVTYNQATDVAMASGNVSLLDKTGTVMFFDTLEVTGDLKEGLATDVRVLLADKSRMASRTFRRREGRFADMIDAVYSACDVCKDRPPVWQIRAGNVTYDQEERMVYYRNARVDLLGVPIFYTPYLAHPDPTSGRKSGLLLPKIGGGANLGFSFEQPYYFNIAPNRDAILAPLITTSAGKGVTGDYRQAFSEGELRMSGSIVGNDPDVPNDVRGHLRGTARWHMSESWRSGADVQLASDRTYLRRYGFEAPTWLTTRGYVEHFTSDTYFSADTFYFQRQRGAVGLSATPVIAPLIRYAYVSDPVIGDSYFTADMNGVVLQRTNGVDSNRLSAQVGWHVPYTSPLGDIYTLRATLRGDGYYVNNVPRPDEGDQFDGAIGRAVPELSLEWRYPFVKTEGLLQQTIEPIVMGVISPIGQNPDAIPNEDSRDFEFDDTNLFDPQRTTGFDRVEGGARINYGLRWTGFGTRGGYMSVFAGQSYRLHRDDVFNSLSGLNERLSDIVGRIDVSPSPWLSMLYRFRIDKDNFASRRSELGGIIGPDLFRLGVNYLYVAQGDPTNLTLGDREELYVSMSSRLTRNWSINANHREDLSPNGGRIRTALGFTYEDECFIFGLDIADDKTEDRDFKSGLSVLLRFNLKTLGELNLNTNVGAAR